MKKIIITTLFLLHTLGLIFSQSDSSINYKIKNSSRTENNLAIEIEADCSKLNLHSTNQLIISPSLKSVEGDQFYSFDAITIAGANRTKALKRQNALKRAKNSSKEEAKIFKYKKGDTAIVFTLNVAYEKWMRNAQIEINEQKNGCSDCDLGNRKTTIPGTVLPEIVFPAMQMGYITPESEEIKERKERWVAYFNYKVGRWELLPNFKENAKELERVDKVLKEVLNDINLEFTELHIKGYASPEGTYNYNMTLSEKRAKTFLDYLIKKYKFTKEQIQVEWFGEDWDGLLDILEKENNIHKAELAKIIAQEPDVDKRDKLIKELNGGTLYSSLLNDIYPQLRRNEYIISFVARAFDIEETKKLIKTKPSHLSVNEMFILARSLEEGSDEFNEVLRTTAEVFPENEYAAVNAAIVDINEKKYDAAILRLENLKDSPLTWNILAIALANKEKYDEAIKYFEAAKAKNNSTATKNLEILRKYINHKD